MCGRVRDSACGSVAVWQYVWQCEAVHVCMRQCGRISVCGRARGSACGSVLGSVRQCVKECEAVREAVCVGVREIVRVAMPQSMRQCVWARGAVC